MGKIGVAGQEFPESAPQATTTPPQGISAAWSPAIRRWERSIVDAAQQYHMDPDLVAAVMTVESGGNPRALSSAGAIGLMQIMPMHNCASWEPATNISCGVHILAYYQQRAGGDWRAGLAAYNAGETGRDVYGRGWDYADLVLTLLADPR